MPTFGGRGGALAGQPHHDVVRVPNESPLEACQPLTTTSFFRLSAMPQLLANPSLILVFALLALLTSGTAHPGATPASAWLRLRLLHPVAVR